MDACDDTLSWIVTAGRVDPIRRVWLDAGKRRGVASASVRKAALKAYRLLPNSALTRLGPIRVRCACFHHRDFYVCAPTARQARFFSSARKATARGEPGRFVVPGKPRPLGANGRGHRGGQHEPGERVAESARRHRPVAFTAPLRAVNVAMVVRCPTSTRRCWTASSAGASSSPATPATPTLRPGKPVPRPKSRLSASRSWCR